MSRLGTPSFTRRPLARSSNAIPTRLTTGGRTSTVLAIRGKKKMRKLVSAAALVVAALGATAASAATITFDEQTNSGQYVLGGPVYTTQGFNFSSSDSSNSSAYVFWGSAMPFNADTNGATLGFNSPNQTVTVTRCRTLRAMTGSFSQIGSSMSRMWLASIVSTRRSPSFG